MADKYAKIRTYLDDLLGPSGLHSTSHLTLREVENEHGREWVADLLKQYWAEFGDNGERDPFNEYAGK